MSHAEEYVGTPVVHIDPHTLDDRRLNILERSPSDSIMCSLSFGHVVRGFDILSQHQGHIFGHLYSTRL